MNADEANDTIDAARRLQRALYRAAKASPERRFHALYDKVYREDILARAWREVRANAGAAGVDGQTIKDVERRGVEGFLEELATELREGRVSAATSAAGADPEGRREAAPVGDSDGAGSGGPGCREGGAGADLRGRLSGQLVRVPSEAERPPGGGAGPPGRESRWGLGGGRRHRGVLRPNRPRRSCWTWWRSGSAIGGC